VRLEAAKAILDRYLGRPAIQADISLNRAEADGHIAALIEAVRRSFAMLRLAEDGSGPPRCVCSVACERGRSMAATARQKGIAAQACKAVLTLPHRREGIRGDPG
jgi:hypothetical protein